MSVATAQIVVRALTREDAGAARAADELRDHLRRILAPSIGMVASLTEGMPAALAVTVAVASPDLHAVIARAAADDAPTRGTGSDTVNPSNPPYGEPNHGEPNHGDRPSGEQDPRVPNLSDLRPDEYVIVSQPHTAGEHVWIIGADGAACRTGVFQLLRHLGCDFSLSGDRLPPPSPEVPRIDVVQRYSPRFALRGTQFWCYWYAGRDSWGFDDYRAYLDQFPKLGLNLFDFPLYFYEPMYTDYAIDGVRPEGYFLAGRDLDSVHVGRELFAGAPTGFGSADIPRYGDQPARNAAAIDLMRRVFAYARQQGIRTCVGFELANQLDFARDVLDALPPEDRYEDGRLIQPGSPSARRVLRARLDALFAAYPDCDYYSLWQSEAGVWRTTDGSPHPVDQAFRESLSERYPALAPSDADYLAWLRLADEIVGEIRPDARLVTSGWGSEAVFAAADEVLSDRFVRSSISPYEPRWALEQGGLDFYDRTVGDKWHVTWAETDQHMWVMQPKLAPAAALLDRLETSGVGGLLALHWNTDYCGINLDLFASQCWSPRPEPDEFRQSWAQRRFGADAGPAAANALAELERLGELTLASDPTMQSWVGYECFINPLLQAHRFVDPARPFPESWMTSFVAPHLAARATMSATLDSAVEHARAAERAADSHHVVEARRLRSQVEYVRSLHRNHWDLATAIAVWNRTVAAQDVAGAPDRAGLERAAALVDAIDVRATIESFAAGVARRSSAPASARPPGNGVTADADDSVITEAHASHANVESNAHASDSRSADPGQLGLLLSLNEKLLGGVERLRGRMRRAIDDAPAPFRGTADNALFAVWPGMALPSVSLAARDAPHATAAELADPVARLHHADIDVVEGSGTGSWRVRVSDGVRCQRLSTEVGLWRHPERIAVTLTGPADSGPVRVALYLVEDVDWDSLFRRQAVTVDGVPLGDFDDFLGRGDDLGDGIWVEAVTRPVGGTVTVELTRRGNSDVVLGGIVVLPPVGN